MKNIRRRFASVAAIAMVTMPLLITIYLLFLSPTDLSARQTGKQRVFGATYMTMNNPYFQVLDTQIRGHLELHGDVLLTRDAAMDQQRQNQEIQELVDAGVCAIFMTPVEWDTSKEGVQIAAAAGVPVIVVDAPIQDSALAACSVLSDNYQAGVLCARHLLSILSSAKILLLEHITARSGADRIAGHGAVTAAIPRCRCPDGAERPQRLWWTCGNSGSRSVGPVSGVQCRWIPRGEGHGQRWLPHSHLRPVPLKGC